MDGKKCIWIEPSGVKDIPSPKWEVNENAYWITKTTSSQSKNPSKILERQWNGIEWVYGLHWFKDDKEIKFNVEETRMVQRYVHSADQRLRAYNDAVAAWTAAKNNKKKTIV